MGLRYEIAIAIDGSVVWPTGPYKTGSFPDVVIFQNPLKSMLGRDENVIADRGYPDEKFVTNNHKINGILEALRAKHETLNRKLKSFSVLSSTFRQKPKLQKYVIYSVLNIVQSKLKNEGLFSLSFH